jgi:hypothetical protein
MEGLRGMKKFFLLEMFFPEVLTDDFAASIPSFREYMAALVERHVVLNYAVNLGKKKGWVIFQAEEPEDVLHAVEHFPIGRFIRFDMYELLLRNHDLMGFPKMFMN